MEMYGKPLNYDTNVLFFYVFDQFKSQETWDRAVER